MSREIPCPIRIVDDFGGGFGIGLGLGSILYFIRGCWYSPKSERVYGGITLLKKRAPILGGNFALWGGIFSTTECSLLYLRKTDDHFNPICAGFVTGGSLAIRCNSYPYQHIYPHPYQHIYPHPYQHIYPHPHPIIISL